LNKLEIPKPEIKELFKDWYYFTDFNYVIKILGNGRGHPDPEVEDEPFLQELQSLHNINDIPSPEPFQSFLSKWNLLDEESKEYVKDYKHYQIEKKHR
jgi:hypothetical protein